MRYYYLPKEYRTIHSTCFELVKQIEEFIVGDEYLFLRESHYDLSSENQKLLYGIGDVWVFLKKYKEEQFYSLLNKQLILGLVRDFCYFIQESLDCSNKMRLIISYALLRRPFIDNLKILLRIIADASFYDNFIKRDDYDPASMKENELRYFLNATDTIRFTKPITGAFIYNCVFDKEVPGSIVNLSNRALHPVTTRPWNKTGEMNCNFMFTTTDDIVRLWKHYYANLPAILIFYSELFNYAVFELFKDEVNSALLPKRIEKLSQILSKAYPQKKASSNC
jgi:hypothetical protein